MTAVLDEEPADLGAIRTEITVDVTDLRRALRSVLVHASTDKEETICGIVRLVIQRDQTIVCATNRYTIGLASVSNWSNTYNDHGVIVDLSLTQVAEILALFKAPKDDEDETTLTVRVTDRYLLITDTSGLFPGKSMTWPRITVNDNYPDVLKLMGGVLAAAGTGRATRMHTQGKYLALFKVAAVEYREVILIEPTRNDAGALAISIGDSFVGALMPVRTSEETDSAERTARAGWLTALGITDPDD